MLLNARKVIERATKASRAELDSDEDLAAALVWRLSVIGEAAGRVSQPQRDQTPQIPWTQIVGMRHRLIHGYDAIDLDLVWQTVEQDLPPLVAELDNLLQPPPP
jgi:uncharacterized protein with HEPN domain